ncbi:MAG: AraC family transcriptional regulator [Saprospiraceae bacterium]|nr:AraC family transcriptional regulator [Saprospiraceae bacterium]
MITDFQKIEQAIHFLKHNFKSQPDLNEIARQVCLSPFHFQRMFKDWAGVSPKKFLQYLTLEYAKGLLNNDMAIPEVTEETGLSSTSRLHDLFIGIEGMTPETP